MIIKKILILFYLTAIALATNCMDNEKDFFKAVRQARTSGAEDSQLFIEWVKKLILASDEQEIINFLEKNSGYTVCTLSKILEMLEKAKMYKCVDHLLQAEWLYILESDIANLIMIALNKNDIERVKILTNFNNYLKDGILLLEKYRSDLKILNLDANSIFNRIFLHDKKNYKIDKEDRYLQHILQSNDYIEEILQFIKSAPLEELNAEGRFQNTPLWHAINLWVTPPCDDNDTEQIAILCKNQKKIIHALLKRGVDPKVEQPRFKRKLSDTGFAKFHSVGCKKCQHLIYGKAKSLHEQTEKEVLRNHYSSDSVKIKKASSIGNFKKSSNNVKSKIVVGAGIAMLAIAAVYFGYDYFDSKQINNSIKLK